MLTWRIGDVTISAAVETEAEVPLGIAFPECQPEEFRAADGTTPFLVAGGIRLAMQSFLITAGTRRILVDLCIGNDKHRDLPAFQPLHTDFLQRLRGAGFGRDDVDTVIFTHLHHDHVGWATMREGDAWVPTFGRARHLIDRRELDYWTDQDRHPIERAAFDDSIRPLLDAGLVDPVNIGPVGTEHAVTEEISIIPTRGHTAGHCSVRINSGGQEAVITGDLMHHVCQVVVPERVAFPVDFDVAAAVETRRAFLAWAARSGALVLGTHFPAPTAGHVAAEGGSYRIHFPNDSDGGQ